MKIRPNGISLTAAFAAIPGQLGFKHAKTPRSFRQNWWSQPKQTRIIDLPEEKVFESKLNVLRSNGKTVKFAPDCLTVRRHLQRNQFETLSTVLAITKNRARENEEGSHRIDSRSNLLRIRTLKAGFSQSVRVAASIALKGIYDSGKWKPDSAVQTLPTWTAAPQHDLSAKKRARAWVRPQFWAEGPADEVWNPARRTTQTRAAHQVNESRSLKTAPRNEGRFNHGHVLKEEEDSREEQRAQLSKWHRGEEEEGKEVNWFKGVTYQDWAEIHDFPAVFERYDTGPGVVFEFDER